MAACHPEAFLSKSGSSMKRLALLALLFVVTNNTLLAQNHEAPPRIGLVLAGGGARGLAHAGVLLELQALNIPIAAVAGTSMGSIIAALYAAGYSPEAIHDIALKLDWEQAFTDDAPRLLRSFQRKRDDQLGLVNISAGFNQGKIQVPQGLLEGQNIDLILERLFVHTSNVDDFDHLPIPFRAVATDLVTGEEVVLKSGRLSQAVRASMSVPGILSPKELQNRLLVDGGMVNNLPVTVVRQMDVDYIIAVDVSAPLMKKEALGSVLDVTAQLTNFMIMQNVAYQKDFLTDEDVLIVPDLSSIESIDFDLAEQAIASGREAVIQVKTQLSQWSQNHWQQPTLVASNPVIEFVRVDNESGLSKRMIYERIRQTTGEPLDLDKLEQDISSLYGMGLFQKVGWYVVEENQINGLVITVEPKSWGPNYLQAGIALSNDFDGDSAYNLSFRYHRTAMNPRNGEAGLLLRLGQEPAIELSYHQPLDLKERWYSDVLLGESKQIYDLRAEGQRLARFKLSESYASLALGYELNERLRFEARLQRESGAIKQLVGAEVEQDIGGLDNAFLSFNILHDSLDNAFFPKNGLFYKLSWLLGREDLGSSQDYDAIHGKAVWAKHINEHIWISSAEIFVLQQGELPALQTQRLGGFLRLSGLQDNELLLGQELFLLQTGYMIDIAEKTKLDFGLPVYLGFSVEAGNLGYKDQPIEFSDLIYAGSLFLGVDSFIGPAYLGYGLTDRGESALYFYLNRAFD